MSSHKLLLDNPHTPRLNSFCQSVYQNSSMSTSSYLRSPRTSYRFLHLPIKPSLQSYPKNVSWTNPANGYHHHPCEATTSISVTMHARIRDDRSAHDMRSTSSSGSEERQRDDSSERNDLKYVLGMGYTGLETTTHEQKWAIAGMGELGESDMDKYKCGTAGSVIANRLTENPNFNVLVIEAGPSNEGVLDIIISAFAFQLTNTAYDWNFTMVSQVGLNGRVLTLERGYVLGDSSSVSYGIDGMDYARGSSDDYDRFARVTSDQGWFWNNLQPFIHRNERFVPPADGHNTNGEFNPRVHGFDGIDFDEFPFNLDMNPGKPPGVVFAQSTIGQGERSSAARTYLGLKYRCRPNPHIVTDTFVTRMLSTGVNASLDLRVVEIASNATGPRIYVIATKEVILSAGSIGTPHILMNSGFGDKAELEELGIKSVKTSEITQQRGYRFRRLGRTFLREWQDNATVLAEILAQWKTNRTELLYSAKCDRIGVYEYAIISGLSMKVWIASKDVFFLLPVFNGAIAKV
ncbi:GMC oxidoreductase [Sphaerobolus stellatus SS14]|uniref:GMC oxidoreductase n=1 Tax=Sphaerobolus stellatus (strain SS14) TaxID=990650 RepID=A0A0C9W5U9_SPHS4|nr:GMC oxidoreductase [Sphaerobolus stellatus SS14]